MRSIKTEVAVVLFVFSIAIGALIPQEAQAIPAFARKYNVACNTCHVPSFPKLNDFGNRFRDQGYQMGTDNDLPTHEGISMGYWPVSFRTTVGYQNDKLNENKNKMESSGIGFTGLDILSFGVLTRDVTFGIVYTPGLAGAGFYTGTTFTQTNLESAFVRLDNLERFIVGGSGNYLVNLKVGRFELDSPFSEKRSPSLNTPFSMYHYMAGTPYTVHQASGATNAYGNPNTFIFGNNQNAVSLEGLKDTPLDGTFRYSLAAVSNDSVTGPLQGGTGTGGHDFSFFGHVTQSIGGYGFVTGHRLGLFGVSGNAPTQASTLCPGCLGVGGRTRSFDRIGVDASTTFNSEWNLFGAWMHARDSRGMFDNNPANLSPQEARWNGAFVELDWTPAKFFGLKDMLFLYRFDLIRNEQQGNGDPVMFPRNYNDVNSSTWMARYNFHYSARTDIALHLEYNMTDVKKVALNGGDQQERTSMVGFDLAF